MGREVVASKKILLQGEMSPFVALQWLINEDDID